MSTIRLFHEIHGEVRELRDEGPFPYERGLQTFFEKHLRTLTGIDFLGSEYSTGQRHARRIDTLGIDGAGRPVVVEYKRRQDENVINQGLDYLAWLEDHRAEFRELVREKLGGQRVAHIDFRTPRLLCVAGNFARQDRIAAQNSRRRVDLLRYRRYGDAHVALEWVFGGEVVDPPPPPPDVSEGEENGKQRTLFLKSCDEYGAAVFSKILEWATRRSMSMSWGVKGFSVGIDVDGTRVVVCYAYPPAAVFKQTLYTALHDRAGIERKTSAPPEVIDRLRSMADETGLFVPAGRELKCPIARRFTNDEVDALVRWCESVVQAIAGHGV